MPLSFKEKSLDILYVNELPLAIGQHDLSILSKNAHKNQRQRSRLCVHVDESCNLHEMFMYYKKAVYVRPHKQESKTVSYHLISGHVCVCLFDDDGTLSDVIEMKEFGSGLPFYFRAPSNIYRSMIVLSEEILFHEVTQGPYIHEETRYAPWAPAEQDSHAEMYRNQLMEKVASTLKRSSYINI